VAEWHDLAGRDHHVLLGRGTADRRFVHADDVTHLGTRERHEMLDPVEQVVALTVDEAFRDAVDGGAATVDVVDEELRSTHVLSDVLLLVLGRLVTPQLRGQARVDRCDVQAEAA
jgi:hypothetical protein